MHLENSTLGRINLFLVAVLVAYYSLWVIGLPFVEPEYRDFAAAFFPPVELALAIPAALGSTVFLVLLARAYWLVRQDRNEEAIKKQT